MLNLLGNLRKHFNALGYIDGNVFRLYTSATVGLPARLLHSSHSQGVAFTDYVLGGGFLTYGWDLVRWHRGEGREFVSPAVMAFPRIAMCTFLKYGQSGTLENLEAICVLPLNILNEKLFAFLWFWYLVLLLLGVPAVAYRVLLLVSAPLRRRLLGWRYPDSQRISAVVSSLSAGDVFLLCLVGQNVDSLVFSQLVAELSRRLVKLLPAVPSAPPLL
ncbi:hypothetical protein HPB48_008609 [Haemaphysalis longicornis]|uniref:Innexin n=1 Tax=Haemaphysalis longicornis TaxID=44386 RepID=A0A9J6GSB6_HAELO|nr:hypothetical protein HPB48_008609 [Haemaphysalis longicornis]